MCIKRAIGIGAITSMVILFFTLSAFGFVKGDVNGDDQVGIEEAIYSLQTASNFKFPLSSKTINVPSEIPTIQEAVDAAAEGDTIKIAEGTYNEALKITRKALVLRGDDRATTIINNGGTGHGIEIDNSPGVVIENLTIQNFEKGIYFPQNSTIRMYQVTVKDCADSGVYLTNNSYAEIEDSSIEQNGEKNPEPKGDGINVCSNSGIELKGLVECLNNGRFCKLINN